MKVWQFKPATDLHLCNYPRLFAFERAHIYLFAYTCCPWLDNTNYNIWMQIQTPACLFYDYKTIATYLWKESVWKYSIRAHNTRVHFWVSDFLFKTFSLSKSLTRLLLCLIFTICHFFHYIVWCCDCQLHVTPNHNHVFYSRSLVIIAILPVTQSSHPQSLLFLFELIIKDKQDSILRIIPTMCFMHEPWI